ncbi:MAG: dephospho-CoA kinase [Chloroflexi bacterium]|nr:dephospho-CoA kinase [Chloroflexota bacterium]
MVVIGLTGGIASGKSTVAAQLQELGAKIIDADRLGHRVYEPGTAGFQKVVNAFGHDIVARDGTIDRRVLGGKVFGAPEEMERLTDIVWPEIRKLAAAEISEHRRKDRHGIVVLEAAVLFEARWEDLVDEVWVTTVKIATAVDRLMTRNGLTEEQAMARIQSQMSNRERLARADVKIDNSGTLEELRRRVERQWKQLQKRIATPARRR